MKNLFIISQESLESKGVKNKEIEYVLFARIPDMSILKKAKGMERQEQWEIDIPKTGSNAAPGRMRIRKSTVKGVVSYVQAIKSVADRSAQKGKAMVPISISEIESDSSEAAFEQFKLFSSKGMVKERYFFDVPGTGLQWEVDVFIQANGSRSEWCKIDLEVPEPLEKLPKLMDGFVDVIYNQRGQRTAEEEKIIVDVWNNQMIRANEYI